jgi:uncharacterized protein YcbX
MPSVSALHVYPIKSCRGLEMKAVRFDHLGPPYDRRFMLVDEDGRFLTQRELPRLALVEPRLGPTSLQVSAPLMPMLKVAMTQRDAKRIKASIWKHHGEAEDAGENAAAWFSQFLERKCRLVRLPDDAPREVDPAYTRAPALVGFADGFPVLLLSEASLEDLNGRLQAKVPMNRFRPNVVVKDCEAFAEDTWKRIRIGEVALDVVKPCGRCTTVTVDQRTGVSDKEPLATLSSYRTRDNHVLFGQNCVHESPGSIRVGDEVEILETI